MNTLYRSIMVFWPSSWHKNEMALWLERFAFAVLCASLLFVANKTGWTLTQKAAPELIIIAISVIVAIDVTRRQKKSTRAKLIVHFSQDQPHRHTDAVGGTTNYRMEVYNDGPNVAENVEVWLKRITPRPRRLLFPADYPYISRSITRNTESHPCKINAQDRKYFEILKYWIPSGYGSGVVMVDNINTKELDSRKSSFPMELDEVWRMEYSITCANAESIKAFFEVLNDGKDISVLRL